MFYSLIMALIMLALGIVSFWGRNQDSFDGIYATAPLTSTKTNWTDKKGKAVDLTELKPDKQGTLTIYYRLPEGRTSSSFSPDISSRLTPISGKRKFTTAIRKSRLTG